jgi:hypothetical protein
MKGRCAGCNYARVDRGVLGINVFNINPRVSLLPLYALADRATRRRIHESTGRGQRAHEREGDLTGALTVGRRVIALLQAYETG